MNVGPSRPKLPNEIWSSSSEPYAVVRSASTLTWNVSVAERSPTLTSSPVAVMISTPSTSTSPARDVVARRAQVEPVVAERERVVAVAGVDADAVDLAGGERELLAVERDLEPAGALVERDRVVVGAAGDDQRAALDAHRQRALDELALAVLQPRALDVAADLLGERPREVGVVERGDEQQVLVLRDRAAEQPLARLGVVEQPVAQRRSRSRAGTSSSTPSTAASPPGSLSNVSTDCCLKRARIVSAIVCSSSSETRSTSNSRERSKVVVAAVGEDAVEQLRAARRRRRRRR